MPAMRQRPISPPSKTACQRQYRYSSTRQAIAQPFSTLNTGAYRRHTRHPAAAATGTTGTIAWDTGYITFARSQHMETPRACDVVGRQIHDRRNTRQTNNWRRCWRGSWKRQGQTRRPAPSPGIRSLRTRCFYEDAPAAADRGLSGAHHGAQGCYRIRLTQIIEAIKNMTIAGELTCKQRQRDVLNSMAWDPTSTASAPMAAKSAGQVRAVAGQDQTDMQPGDVFYRLIAATFIDEVARRANTRSRWT